MWLSAIHICIVIIGVCLRDKELYETSLNRHRGGGLQARKAVNIIP